MNKRQIRTLLLTIFLTVIALVMLFPVVLTMVSSLMTEKEIMLNYGMLGNTKMNDFVNLKLTPDWVSLEQFFKVLISTSQFLRMFWNSVFMVFPIIIGQVVVAYLRRLVCSCSDNLCSKSQLHIWKRPKWMGQAISDPLSGLSCLW